MDNSGFTMEEKSFDELLKLGQENKIALKAEQKNLVESRKSRPGGEFGVRTKDHAGEAAALSKIGALNQQRDRIIEQLRQCVCNSPKERQHSQKRRLAEVLNINV
ncbi:hypothetical protein ACFL02_01795 [Planctomycetota bacterium]